MVKWALYAAMHMRSPGAQTFLAYQCLPTLAQRDGGSTAPGCWHAGAPVTEDEELERTFGGLSLLVRWHCSFSRKRVQLSCPACTYAVSVNAAGPAVDLLRCAHRHGS